MDVCDSERQSRRQPLKRRRHGELVQAVWLFRDEPPSHLEGQNPQSESPFFPLSLFVHYRMAFLKTYTQSYHPNKGILFMYAYFLQGFFQEQIQFLQNCNRRTHST